MIAGNARPSVGRSIGRRSRLAGLPFLMLLAGLAACSDSSAPREAAPAPAEVGFVVLHPQEVTIGAEVSGRVTALRTAEIRPQVNGIVRERVFQEGTEVKEGDVLYVIDPQSYQAQVTSAEAALRKAEAAVPSAKAKADRYANLSVNSVVSQQDREDAQATFLQAQADVAVAQADLETARINLGYTTIRAPIPGQIGLSSVNTGALVTAAQTDALATIRQIDTVYVDLTESSGNLLRFQKELENGALRPLVGPGKVAPKVKLTLADGTPYPQEGEIDTAERFVSETTSSFTVRSRFPNPADPVRVLLPGMYVRASVTLGVDDKGYLLPQRAVTRNNKGEATARFVTADGKAETRVLAVSRDIGPNWLVTGGVAQGDRLIVDGLQKAQDGQPVSPVEVAIDASGNVRRPEAAAAQARADGQAAGVSATAAAE